MHHLESHELQIILSRCSRVSNCDHGWNEVKHNGKNYVIDTEMNCSVQYPELNWFMVRYSDARIKYYDTNMNRVVK